MISPDADIETTICRTPSPFFQSPRQHWAKLKLHQKTRDILPAADLDLLKANSLMEFELSDLNPSVILGRCLVNTFNKAFQELDLQQLSMEHCKVSCEYNSVLEVKVCDTSTNGTKIDDFKLSMLS